MKANDDLRDWLQQIVHLESVPEPPVDEILARGVRRIRRRRAMTTVVGGVLVAVLAATLFGLHGLSLGPGRVETAAGAIFPGEGHILFADSDGLKWLSRDGSSQMIASGFVGGKIPARRPTPRMEADSSPWNVGFDLPGLLLRRGLLHHGP